MATALGVTREQIPGVMLAERDCWQTPMDPYYVLALRFLKGDSNLRYLGGRIEQGDLNVALEYLMEMRAEGVVPREEHNTLIEDEDVQFILTGNSASLQQLKQEFDNAYKPEPNWLRIAEITRRIGLALLNRDLREEDIRHVRGHEVTLNDGFLNITRRLEDYFLKHNIAFQRITPGEPLPKHQRRGSINYSGRIKAPHRILARAHRDASEGKVSSFEGYQVKDRIGIMLVASAEQLREMFDQEDENSIIRQLFDLKKGVKIATPNGVEYVGYKEEKRDISTAPNGKLISIQITGYSHYGFPIEVLGLVSDQYEAYFSHPELGHRVYESTRVKRIKPPFYSARELRPLIIAADQGEFF